jgi:hypothetical protein
LDILGSFEDRQRAYRVAGCGERREQTTRRYH